MVSRCFWGDVVQGHVMVWPVFERSLIVYMEIAK